VIRAQHWWLVVAVLIVVALVVSLRTDRQVPAPEHPAVAAHTSSPTLAPPSHTPTPPPSTPSPAPVTGSWSVTLPIEPEPTATWPPPPPTPTATPTPARCVTAESSTYQAFGPQPHVVVEVELINRCRRDFEPLDIWVRVQGWRQGGLVQQVKGHPFDRLYAGGSQRLGLGLPGSEDWYDEIRIEIEEPSAP
jgi:hypothetical protein